MHHFLCPALLAVLVLENRIQMMTKVDACVACCGVLVFDRQPVLQHPPTSSRAERSVYVFCQTHELPACRPVPGARNSEACRLRVGSNFVRAVDRADVGWNFDTPWQFISRWCVPCRRAWVAAPSCKLPWCWRISCRRLRQMVLLSIFYGWRRVKLDAPRCTRSQLGATGATCAIERRMCSWICVPLSLDKCLLPLVVQSSQASAIVA